jgi:threonine 3-dehydrogenase
VKALHASTIFALKKNKPETGLTMVSDAQVPEVGPREVLIGVSHAGICGTDRHIYQWDPWSAGRVPLGITIGHEFVGRVVEVGNAVVRTKVGERVTAEGHIGCGKCEPCRTGNGHICEKVQIIGVDRDGCFAQYVAVPEENIWPVHDDIPDTIAAILDPIGNAMHTVMATNVSGRSVLITGVGIIGLMAVAIARAAGAGTIIVSDIEPRRMALAKELGADIVYEATDEEWPAKARHATHSQGPQVLMEMSGNPQAIRDGFRALRNGGTVALLGTPSKPVEMDLSDDIIFKGATVLGINGRLMYETWFQVESFLLSGRIDLRPVITHQVEFADYDRAFKMMLSGEAIKVVMKLP